MAFEAVGVDNLIIVAILCAIVAFFYSNLGLGGGQLYVPIMVIFFASLEVREIIPISLAFAFATMLSSSYSHGAKGLVDWRLGAQLAVGGLLGVVAGVLVTWNAPENYIKTAFASMLIIVATKMVHDIYRDKKEPAVCPRRFSLGCVLAGVGVSVLTGLLIGMFGIGGGIVSVPLIIYVFKLESRRAIGTSALMGAILTPAALAAYVVSENVSGGMVIQYDVLLVLTPLVFVMALIGSRWGLAKLKTKVVKTIFTGGVYLAAIGMIYSLLTG